MKFKILKPLSLSLSLSLALACRRVFINTNSIENKGVIGPENTLFAGASVPLSPRKFYRLGSEEVKGRFVAWQRGLPWKFEDCVFALINSVLLNLSSVWLYWCTFWSYAQLIIMQLSAYNFHCMLMFPSNWSQSNPIFFILLLRRVTHFIFWPMFLHFFCLFLLLFYG